MDDRRAIERAQAVGLRTIRTTAVYVTAKRLQLIVSVREKLDRLREAGFWLQDEHYHAILHLANEL